VPGTRHDRVGPYISPGDAAGHGEWTRPLLRAAGAQHGTDGVQGGGLGTPGMSEANIPSTTALATINRRNGRELGLMRGAMSHAQPDPAGIERSTDLPGRPASTRRRRPAACACATGSRRWGGPLARAQGASTSPTAPSGLLLTSPVSVPPFSSALARASCSPLSPVNHGSAPATAFSPDPGSDNLVLGSANHFDPAEIQEQLWTGRPER
jgi:hypothetical protein